MADADHRITLPTLPATSDNSVDITAGTILCDGRFRVLRLLGKGGSASVYQASDLGNEEKAIAVKVVPAVSLADAARQSLLREVETARALHHPHIAAVYALYQEPARWLLTMEYVDGISLRQLLADEGPVKWREFCRLFSQLCAGLDYAHGYLCHCDLKPENILLEKKPEGWHCRIVDFGQARLKSEVPAGAVRGTFPYLAPEQYLRESAVDARADIYALGVVCYELLSGHLPLGCFPWLRELRSDIPPWTDELLRRMLAYDRDKRFADIAGLQRWWHGQENLSCQPVPVTEIDAEAEKYLALAEIELGKIEQRLHASGLLTAWVARRPPPWNETQWQEFRRELRSQHGIILPARMLQALVAKEQERLRQRRDHVDCQTALLHLCLQQGDWQRAHDVIAHLHRWGADSQWLQSWQRHLAERHRQSEQLLTQAAACLESHLYDEAAAALERASNLQPESIAVQRAAADARQKAQTARRQQEQTIVAARLLHDVGEWEQAIDLLAQLASQMPTPAAIKAELASWRAQLAGEKSQYDGLQAQWFREIALDEWPQAAELLPAHFRPLAADFRAGCSRRLARRYRQEYASRQGLPCNIDIALPDEVTLRLTLVPPGIFTQGAEVAGSSRSVLLPRAFYCAVCPVTQGQWEAVTGQAPDIDKGSEYPLERVTWDACEDFIDRLNWQSGRHFGLPSEAQWEYACRAGSAAAYCYGADAACLGEFAWYAANSLGHTHQVASKKANAWGLFDMHGLVWEWCRDWYADYTHGNQLDPQGPTSGTQKVWRGGNVCSPPEQCTCFYRQPALPAATTQIAGLRVVMAV